LRIKLLKSLKLFLNDPFNFPVHHRRSLRFFLQYRTFFECNASYESSGHKKRSAVRPARFIDFHDWSLSLLLRTTQQINIHPWFPVLFCFCRPLPSLSGLYQCSICSICVHNLHAWFYSAEHGFNLSSVLTRLCRTQKLTRKLKLHVCVNLEFNLHLNLSII